MFGRGPFGLAIGNIYELHKIYQELGLFSTIVKRNDLG